MIGDTAGVVVVNGACDVHDLLSPNQNALENRRLHVANFSELLSQMKAKPANHCDKITAS